MSPVITVGQRPKGVTLSKGALNLHEGGTGSYTVVLDAAPTGNVTITPSSGDVTAVTVSTAAQNDTLTFTTGNWETPQTVTVAAVEDADSDNETVTVSHAISGGGYGSVTVGSVTVNLKDNEKTLVSLTLGASSINESGNGNSTTVKATISSAFSSELTVTVAADPAGAVTLPATPTLTIAANATESGTLTVTAVDNKVDADDAVVVLSGTVGNAAVNDPDAISLTIVDDDTKGVTISTTDLSVNEGATASYTVKLNSQPSDDVTVTPTSSDETSATVSIAGSASLLTFTPANWNTPQSVTVNGQEDDDTSDDSAVISHAVAGADYDSVSAASVNVSVVDNDDDVAPTVTVGTVPSGTKNSKAVKVTVADRNPADDLTAEYKLIDGSTCDASAYGTEAGTTISLSDTAADDGNTKEGTVTFSSEAANSKYICVKAGDGTATSYGTATQITGIDTTAPTLTSPSSIGTTTDNTPDFTFTSSEAGTISYGGACSSPDTAATASENTVTFNTLADGVHADCTVTVTDEAGNRSDALDVPDFTVDATDPGIEFPSGAPTVGTAATITLTDATSKVAKFAVLEVDGSATNADGCDDPGADGDNFPTTAVSPAVSPKTVSHTPVTAGKKVCVYAEDAAGNSNAELWGTAVAAADTTGPTVSAIAITSSVPANQNGHYKIGDKIEVTVTFDESIFVTGAPKLTLKIGSNDRAASCAKSTTDAKQLICAYTVQNGDEDTDGIEIEANQLEAPTGATVKDSANNDADLDHNALTAQSGHKVDGKKPAVSSVAFDGTPGSMGIFATGETIKVNVTFGETVQVSGKPTADLRFRTSGSSGTTKKAVYKSGTGTTVLKFEYVVESGIRHEALQIGLLRGDIKDTAGNPAVLTHDGVASADRIKADAIGPKPVRAGIVSTAPAGGNVYRKGDKITFGVAFNENVKVATTGGSPTLGITVGTISRQATYDSSVTRDCPRPSGTPAARCAMFAYTVQAGDVDLDGVTVPANGLKLNGGGITDLLGNAATSLAHKAVPDPSALSGSPLKTRESGKQAQTKVNGLTAADLLVFSATSVTVVEGASATYDVKLKAPPAAELKITPASSDIGAATVSTAATDDTLTFTESNWNTNQAVTVTGVQDVDTNDESVTATHALSGDNTGYAGSSASSVMVTVTDDEGMPSVVGAPQITSAPAVSGSNTYGNREKIKVTIGFSEAITVTGTPRLTIKVGAADKTADCARKGNSSPDNAKLECVYTVAAGDADIDGISIEANKLSLPTSPAATIKDSASNDADLDHSALTAQSGHKVDGSAPEVANDGASVEISSTPASGEHYIFGEQIVVTATFTEAVTVEGTPRLKIKVGANDRWAQYSAGSGTAALKFSYTVAGGDSDSNGIEVVANSLELNGGKIRDAVNNADLGHDSIAASTSHKVDGVRPKVVGKPQFTGTPAAHSTYAKGEKIKATVTFSEAVTVTGTPGLAIRLQTVNLQTHKVDMFTPRVVTAQYKSGTGTASLTFEHEVADGDYDENGISFDADAISGGTIEDANGNTAVLTHASEANDATRKVDGLRPTVKAVSIGSSPSAGNTYGAGETIKVAVQFREKVDVTGTPQLRIDIGGTERAASYARRNAAMDTLEFEYAVAATDGDADGISIKQNALALNGGTIRDIVGNAANLAHAALGRQPGHRVNGASAAGEVTISKLRLTIAEGTKATYTVRLGKAPVGGNVTVTPVAGDTGAVSVSPSSLSFTGGASGNWNRPQTVTVTAKQDADQSDENFQITHTVSGANYGSVTAPAIQVRVSDDDTNPGFVSITETSSPASGDTYLLGETIQITVRYSKPVFVTGNPYFVVYIGGAGKQAGLASGSGTASLVFEYAVQAADRETTRLSYVSQAIQGGGTIKDADGNDAPRSYTGRTTFELSRNKVNGGQSAAGVSVSKTEVTVPEGDSRTYTVRLLKAPTTNVTIAVGITGDTDLTVEPSSLTFTTGNWNRMQTVTVSAAADDDAINGTATISHTATSSDTAYSGIAVRDVTAFESDSGGLPAKPGNFRALPANGKVTLSWDDPMDAGIARWEYRQKAGTGAFGGWIKIPNSGAGTKFHDVTALENGTLYTFQVRAVNATGNGPPSDEATATPSTRVAEAPDQVTGVSVEAGAGQLTVTWDAVAGATGYKVQWKSGNQVFATGRQATSTTTSHTIADLTPGTEYTVRVIATKTNAPDGAASVEATGTPAFLVPAAPTGLTAAKDGRFAIGLSWTAPAVAAGRAPATGYEIEWSANGTDGWTDLTTITGAATVTHEDSGLDAGTTRHYRVRATSSAGAGAWSASASATTDANAAPAFDPATASREVDENAAAGTEVGAAIPEATDADADDTLTYVLGGVDAGSFAFDAGTRQITVKSGASPDYETKSSYAVTVTASDGHGGSGELAVTVTVANVDEAGSVTFDSTAPAVGTALTASLMDPDGNVSSVTWQWAKSSTKSGTYADISSATSASYTPTADDAGAWLRATASYTDAEGSGKSAAAVAAAAVADTTGPSVTGALAITSESGVSKADDTIEVTVTFDEAIVVTGTPELRIRVGSGSGSEKTATCARKGSTGDDAKKLVCSYTVTSGDEDTDGVSVEANKLSLPSSATIKDSSNNDATLTHAALPAQSGHKVDAVAPAAPVSLAAAAGDAKVTLTWSDPSPADASIAKWQYRQKTTGAYGSWQDVSGGAAARRVEVGSLANGTAYTFEVRAVDAASNEGAAGTAGPATPMAADTTAPTVTAGSTGYFSDAAAATALTGPQKAAANIYTKVTFSEDMKHVKSDAAAARPELFYRIGTTDTQYDILNNGDTLASGDCKPDDASDTDVYVCLYTVGSSDNGAFTVKAGTNSQDKAGNALAAYTHATTLALDTAAPAAPSALALASGAASPGNDTTPSIEVTVGETGGEVTLYSDAACTTAASAATDVTDTSSPYKVTVDATALATDGSVTFHARHADAAGNVSACSSASVAYTYDGTDPGIEFPSSAPRVGVASTVTLTDAGAKIEKYGAIAVDGSTGAATDCDMASEIGAGNLTTLDTPLASVNYSYTPPADSAGRKVCVYAEDAAGNSDSSLWGTAIAALQPPVAPTDLTAAKDGRFAIGLSWTAPAVAAGRAAATGYEIQRSANGTDGWTDLTTITGAATVTHEDSGLDAGTTRHYRVRATSSAGAGAWSASASATTDANAAPAFDPATASREVDENAAAGTEVGAAIPEATDADADDTLTYVLGGVDAGSFAFDAGTRQITVKSGASPDYETKSSYAVTVTASDGHGGSGELAVTVTVANVDEAGSVTFDSTAPAVGTALTASLMDPDGNVSSVTWQWAKSSTKSGTYADISSATSASYTPTADDAGAWLRATASYTDAEGSGKSAAAVAAAAVADTTGPSVTGALAITSESGVSKADDTIEVTVTFDEAIVVTGTPELRIRVGSGSGSEKTATCARKGSTGDDAKKLVCSYTVTSGDEDTDGVSVEANKLSLPSSATIKDSSNNDATLTHAALPAQSGHKVDAVAPTVTAGSTGYFSDAAAATALTGPQKAAANIYTKVTFSEDMKHVKSDAAAARPELFYRIGTTDTQYDILNNGDTLASGDCKPEDSTGTDVYVCLHTVGSSDSGAFTVRVGTNSQDKADNALAAVYTHTATLTLDTTDPGIAFPAGAPTTGTAATITLTDAGAKIRKYGAIAVDGSATDAAGCDTASEVGAGNLETLDTPATPVDYSYTPPADSAGKKVCVYVEDAAGNSHAELWTTAIAAAAPTPAKPTGFTQTAGAGQVTLSWADPGDFTITKYQYQQKAGDGAWGAWRDIPSSAPGGANATSYTVTGLMDGTAYRFRIRAVNARGSGPNLASAGPATPQATVAPPSGPNKLVGNVAQPVASGYPVTFKRDVAQQFTTGRHPGGYTLTHLDLAIENRGATAPSYSVTIHAPRSSPDRNYGKSTLPGDVLGTLTNPGSLPRGGGGLVRFTAPGNGIDLEPGRPYVVMIDVGEGASRRVRISTAATGAEDSDGVAHWSIQSISRTRKAGSTGRWVNEPSLRLRMAVYGTAKAAPPPDPALVPPGALWSASLTVQGYRNLLGGALGCGLMTGARCSVGLSINEFTYNGVRYRFDAIQRDGNRDTLQLSILNPAADPEEVLEAGAALAASGSLTLHVDGRAFAFADARLQYERLHWDDARLGWRTWQRVSLALTDAGAPSGAPAPVAPGLEWARVNGAELALRFDAGLDESSVPAASAFPVSVAGASRAVSSVAVSGETVTLTLAEAVASGEAVTVGYAPPGSGKLRLAGGGAAVAAFTDQAVTNDTPSGSRQQGPTPEAAALTASVSQAPAEHAGRGRFDVRIAFSEAVAARAKDAAATIQVAGGTLTRAVRVDKRKDLWALTLEPSGYGAVTVTLPAASDCAAAGAVCTADGRKLASALTHTVPGPVTLSVADARAREGEDDTMDFAVTLSRAASGEVTVRYATRDGTAKKGKDYRQAKGTLSFAAGETAKTVSVAILDDAKDEGEETFALVLKKAEGAVIADGEAVGTIENDDPLPAAWLARFGRTVAGQALDAVTERLDGGGASHVTLGGQQVSLDSAQGRAEAAEEIDAVAAALGAGPADRWPRDPWTRAGEADEGAGLSSRTMTGRELLLGSAFHLQSGGEAGGPAFTAWGRVSTGGFDGEEDGVRMDGTVTTGFLGADVTSGRWLAGAAVAVSEGEGTFALSGAAAGESAFDKGEVESTLTSVLPYARLELNERLTAWAMAGYGTGELTLTEKGGTESERHEADLTLTLGALGGRGTLVDAPEGGGFALALKGDALWVRTESDATEGMEGATADVTRLRLTLDASRPFALGESTLTPSLEAGVRLDGGDAETGAGVELGAGLGWADPASGVSAELRGRWLAAHESSGYEEWGASGSLRIDPGASGRGLSLTLASVVGAAGSGTGNLWSAADARGIAPGREFEAARSLDSELGYGLSGPFRLGTATPYAGLGLADGGARAWRAGVRWRVAPEVSLGLEGTRSESASADPEQGLMLRGAVRW